MTLTRSFFLTVLGTIVAVMILAEGHRAQASDRKTNIIFILVDDLGWADVGCFGSKFYETPNIDRLAQQGMKFTAAYAASPVCSPTRTSILSGKYPARTDTTDWFGAPQPNTIWMHWTMFKLLKPAPYVDELPLEEITIAEALNDGGYKTFFAGKWHCGDEGFYPEDQGFDINKGGWKVGSPKGGYFAPYRNPRLESGPRGEHLPDRLASETIDFISQNRDNPFLAYLSFYSVHIPLQAKAELIRKYKLKAKSLGDQGQRFIKTGSRKVRQIQDHPVYAAMIESMDGAIGRVLDSLDDLGLSENTAIIFMSDNGGLATSEGRPTSNLPLKAGKGWLYEGGVREPMIIKWPGVTESGSICDLPVTSTDFYPTMLEMAGLPLMPEQHLDGQSLVPLLKQRGIANRGAIYWHYPHYGNQGGSPCAAVRLGDWKLIEFFEDNRLELYNLKDDIGEHNNLADKQPEKAEEMQAMLHQWQLEVDAKETNPNMANCHNWLSD